MQQTPVLTPAALSGLIRGRALELGFDRVGIAPVHPSAHGDAYARWVALGMHGEMGYMAREDAVARRQDPAVLVPGVRSAVVVALDYAPPHDDPADPDDPSRAVVARYARGDDYHELMKERLIALQEWIAAELLPVGGRAYVDTGAVLERELASRAGLGWHGKNTMLIHPRRGSYFFIGEVLLDVELEYDEPFAKDHCGTCQRCLDACPTGALLGRDPTGAPLMDARRCISYLTIELKGPIPRELRPLIGNRVYGCDICQEVCPFNRKFPSPSREPTFAPRPGVDGANLTELMSLTPEEFARRFRGSPVKRTKRRGLLRNVAVALGNWGSPEAVPALEVGLRDPEPLVRGHSAWALGAVASAAECPPDVAASAAGALVSQLASEPDPWVREEI
ncbi:MAG: tRNA epoxyqueuosine(34) reductase QueG, partial [Longimicrobiaceae bacterium]